VFLLTWLSQRKRPHPQQRRKLSSFKSKIWSEKRPWCCKLNNRPSIDLSDWELMTKLEFNNFFLFDRKRRLPQQLLLRGIYQNRISKAGSAKIKFSLQKSRPYTGSRAGFPFGENTNQNKQMQENTRRECHHARSCCRNRILKIGFLKGPNSTTLSHCCWDDYDMDFLYLPSEYQIVQNTLRRFQFLIKRNEILNEKGRLRRFDISRRVM